MVKRPTGITILSVVTMVLGFILIIYTILPLSFLTIRVSIVGIFFGVSFLIFGLGLWKLKNWARIFAIYGTIIVASYSLASLLFALFSSYYLFSGDYTGIIPLSISAIIIWYLLQPNVKSTFAG